MRPLTSKPRQMILPQREKARWTPQGTHRGRQLFGGEGGGLCTLKHRVRETPPSRRYEMADRAFFQNTESSRSLTTCFEAMFLYASRCPAAALHTPSRGAMTLKSNTGSGAVRQRLENVTRRCSHGTAASRKSPQAAFRRVDPQDPETVATLPTAISLRCTSVQ